MNFLGYTSLVSFAENCYTNVTSVCKDFFSEWGFSSNSTEAETVCNAPLTTFTTIVDGAVEQGQSGQKYLKNRFDDQWTTDAAKMATTVETAYFEGIASQGFAAANEALPWNYAATVLCPQTNDSITCAKSAFEHKQDNLLTCGGHVDFSAGTTASANAALAITIGYGLAKIGGALYDAFCPQQEASVTDENKNTPKLK